MANGSGLSKLWLLICLTESNNHIIYFKIFIHGQQEVYFGT